eukprot:1181940-Prorocentrum_minimum.AAC.2
MHSGCAGTAGPAGALVGHGAYRLPRCSAIQTTGLIPAVKVTDACGPQPAGQPAGHTSHGDLTLTSPNVYSQPICRCHVDKYTQSGSVSGGDLLTKPKTSQAERNLYRAGKSTRGGGRRGRGGRILHGPRSGPET